MKFFIGLLSGVLIATTIVACAGGSARPNFDKFPKRVANESVLTKCDGKYDGHVCKKVCDAYTLRNKCKKGKERIERYSIEKLINEGYVVISRELFLKLLRERT